MREATANDPGPVDSFIFPENRTGVREILGDERIHACSGELQIIGATDRG